MNYLCRASVYLNSMASTINPLCGMILSDEMQGNAKAQYKIAVELLDLEQVTADFIDHMGLANEMTHAVLKSKRRFMSINKRLIMHLEKNQSQGYHFEDVITTLKLENETLEKEIHFL
ncbi:MAG: hypothetical protein K2H29_08460 [Oscillospiraceae bacterium]|nr:hypothetical protein [Oscillospiraceae bacterium]